MFHSSSLPVNKNVIINLTSEGWNSQLKKKVKIWRVQKPKYIIKKQVSRQRSRKEITEQDLFLL